ncbi:hypothetical protein tinsulaeT_23320 [Thalassotalea insulae]|uniref:Cadherin-like domain-containing protein n=1 Tax=Thalassotalea insulae TaxID=2056778 RepID=A0ABQ6GWI9_9GAMM|nr:cadherin-like domain-containing protein [Thalassotalea insulae]GLX78992.1 hypothetical protein tinsulaeT_23320 [Thalassotalea insulae]
MKKRVLLPLLLLTAACGGGGGSSSSPKATPSTPTNHSPTAVNDVISTSLSTTISIDVLANDSDKDGDELTILSATTDHGGTVAVGNGVLSYTPKDNFLGTETITYEINDGNGGSASATVEVDVSVTLTLKGKVTDEPIANAVVVASIGEQSVEVLADNAGNYSLDISSNSWNSFVTIHATGQDNQDNVELVSQVGSVEKIYSVKGDDNIIEKSELQGVNVTNITTASYALTTRANNNEPATNQAELEMLESKLNAHSVLELAAAIKSIVDNPNATMPLGVDTVLDLALNEELASNLIENVSDSKMQELFAAIANDNELTTPLSLEDIPETLYLTFGTQLYSYYRSQPTAGWKLQFNDDQSGVMYTQKGEPLNKLTFNWSINDKHSLTIVFSSPVTQELSFTDQNGGESTLINGIQELTELTLVRLTSPETVDAYIVTASYNATYDDNQYNRSGDILQIAATAKKHSSSLSFTANELTAGTATYALPVIFHQADKNIFADILVFHSDGTLNSNDSSTWSINDDGQLVISLADGRSIQYQKMFEEDDGVTNVQLTIFDSNKNIIRTFADLMIKQQSDIKLSTEDLTNNYWHFIDEGADWGWVPNYGLLDHHYQEKDSVNWGDIDENGFQIYNYETIFYLNYNDYYSQFHGTLASFTFAFWFYDNNGNFGIEGNPSEDQGTFEENERFNRYYNEWTLNEQGTKLTMNEGMRFPLNVWGKFEIIPMRRNNNRLYVLISNSYGEPFEIRRKNVTFFTLTPRGNTPNAQSDKDKASTSLLNMKKLHKVNQTLH